MGEITEALRRAKGGTVEPEEPAPLEEPPRRAAAQRDAELPARDALGNPEPVPIFDGPDLGADHTVAVPGDRSGPWQGRVVVVDGHGAAAESCRHIALRLRRELDARGARSVAVVSALRGEGKTTVACNLALALASLSANRSVALVDLDLRKPSVAACLGIPREAGIEEVLRGSRGLRSGVAVAIERPPLDVFPVRVAPPEAHELLSGPAFDAFVRELERHYETVLFDTPPVLLVPDAALALRSIAAAIAVARAGRSQRRAFESMCELLPPGVLVGSVLNEGQLPARAHQYGYYGEEPAESRE
jgi:Mrp family chromosome partitioning ATPase